MKKYLLIAHLVFTPIIIKAQITLDHIVTGAELSIGLGYGFKPVQISPSETKYYINDTTTNTFGLYNMDFTPFLLNISVPEPFLQGPDRLQALYITRSLFDCDTSNIEYAYYATGNINKTFYIVRTDGTILFQIDSANGPYGYGNMLGGTDMLRPIINTSSGAKLYLQTHTSGYSRVLVYSLCGTLPVDIFDFSQMNQSFVTVSPNPSSEQLTFQINPPDNINDYELIIFDNGVHEIIRKEINSSITTYKISVQSLSNGTYYYALCTKNKSYQSGKFIIIK